MNNRKICYNSACQYHTCSNNTCLLEQYSRFCFMDTYGTKTHFRFIQCIRYHIKILKWKLRINIDRRVKE